MSENESFLTELARMTDRAKDKYNPPRFLRPFFRNQDRINELLAASLQALNEKLQTMESRLDRLDRNLAVIQAANRNSEVNVADFHQQIASEKAGLEQERVIVTELREALDALLRDETSGRNGHAEEP